MRAIVPDLYSITVEDVAEIKRKCAEENEGQFSVCWKCGASSA